MATDLTCVEEDAENNDCKAFGSSKQVNCLAAADILPSARKLKLDQMFGLEDKNSLPSRSLQVQEVQVQNSSSMRRMSTPLHNTIEFMNGDTLPSLSQGLTKHCAVMELEKGCEGVDKFSDDTSRATGSFFESSENEKDPYAQRYFRNRQNVSVKHESSRTLMGKEDGEEDCSDIEQLIIKEECNKTAAYDESSELPGVSLGYSLDYFPTSEVEHRPCPYCPAMFQSGVGLSNHVRGHLHQLASAIMPGI